jgi:prepilin-type N-terminal cleavage/methylation domain-containing protein
MEGGFMRSRAGFTLLELLVAVAIMGSLVIMAQATYVIYMRDSVEATMKQNLYQLRSAIQQFYADHGRYPYDEQDSFGNPVGFLDTATSELTQGVRSGPNNQFPANRIRYLLEIPVDPTTNLANWRLIPFDNNDDWNSFADVGNSAILNDFNAGEGNGVWDSGTEPLNDDTGENGVGPYGRGDGRPTRGENHVDDDGFSAGGTDPPDVQDVVSSNPAWQHL